MGNLPRLHTMKPPALVLPAFSSGSVFLRSRSFYMDGTQAFLGANQKDVTGQPTAVQSFFLYGTHSCHMSCPFWVVIHFEPSFHIPKDVRMLAGRHKMLVPIKLLGSSQNGNCSAPRFLVRSMVADGPWLLTLPV